jgi:transposase-like protein
VPRTYDPEFRQRVVELVRAGRPVRVVAAELGLAEATFYSADQGAGDRTGLGQAGREAV